MIWPGGNEPVMPPGTRLPDWHEVVQIARVEYSIKQAGLDMGYALIACYPGAPEGAQLRGMPTRPGPVGILLVAPALHRG